MTRKAPTARPKAPRTTARPVPTVDDTDEFWAERKERLRRVIDDCRAMATEAEGLLGEIDNLLPQLQEKNRKLLLPQLQEEDSK